jgi:hypothetical protein
LFNLSASLAKITHIHNTKDVIGVGAARMVITEVEYIFSVCRSMIDLFQEIAAKIWERVKLFEEPRHPKKKLKKSFSGMICFEGRLSTSEELQARFGLPVAWADFYLLHADFFLQIKTFRDNIIHSGSQFQTVYPGEDGYLLNFNSSPFVGMSVWSEQERQGGGCVPLMPALAMVAYQTISICDSFSRLVDGTLKQEEPMVPGMYLFIRGFFDDHFTAVLEDARRRYLASV